MAVVDVHNRNGEKISEIDLSDDIFNVTVKGHILHEVVKMQLANRRAGTSSVKNRSDITGSTKKLFRQKGTGNARSGSVKSPLKKGGGVIFGPHPKDWSYSVPKKVKRLALKMALSSKLQGENLIVVDKFELPEIKTSEFVKIMDSLDLAKTLVVTGEADRNLELSARNIKNTKVLRADGLNVYDILKYEKLVLLEGSIKKIEGRFAV